MLKKLSPTTKRYLAIGISVYLFELLVIVIAQAIGASSVVAVGISFILGLAASFGLQKVITFGDKRKHYKVLIPQLAAFGLLVVFNFGFTVGLTALLEDSIPAIWCRTIALAITTIWNFYLYKTHIFNWKKPAKGSQRKKSAAVKHAKKQHKQLLKRYRTWRSKANIKKLRKFASRPKVAKWYMGLSLAVLFSTTLLWSILGAKLQQVNADQLINARLFDSVTTLQGAFMPDQHSFLLKWPLFYIVQLFNYTPAAFLWVTVATVLLTVAIFVYFFWRIEKRPLVFGTICLMLASVLLLIPAQPYAGALLPVNMAMLATRNLEYVIYIAGLICLAGAPKLKSKEFIGGTLLLSLLIASDRLFLSVGILGAALMLLIYAARKRWDTVTLAARWLFMCGVAAGAALLLIALINTWGITHIEGSQTGPYGLAGSLKTILLGIIFAIGGVLTNFGANPAYDATTFSQIPHSLASHLFSPAGPAYVINIGIFLYCAYVAMRFLASTFRTQKLKKLDIPLVRQLSTVLLWSSVAAIGVFILANHYHQVDARYLSLCMFALFIVLAGWLRPRRVDAELIAVVLPVLILSIICGVIGNIQTHDTQQQAFNNMNYRNKAVAQTLASHGAKVLVGDYWRVLPIQEETRERQQNILPLGDCTNPRDTLTSKVWQSDLSRDSFAYLLSFDKSLTDFPQCDLQQVADRYGVPNSSVLIDGTLAHPKEVLLFYDRGTHFPKTLSTSTNAEEVIRPIELKDLRHKKCSGGTTVINIAAHEDDDLLFMNPDVQRSINNGQCVRTVYLTAGDAGGQRSYWLSRELGSKAAYSAMADSRAAWMDRNVRLPNGQYVTVSNPQGNEKISLIFMHLPDGNLDGRGFGASGHESLAGLEAGSVSVLRSVDEQSAYTSDELVAGLSDLIGAYQPAEVRTQSDYVGSAYIDHSDHRASGRYAKRGYQQSGTTAPLYFYLGYPIRELPANIEGANLQAKENAFSAYALFDRSVCHGKGHCAQNPVYDIYLERQYRKEF